MATALTSELTRFTDRCNKVLAGGIVKTFEPNSLTPKITYQDPLATIPNLPEVALDATGRAKIYIKGDYRIQVYSSDGVLIEDNLLVEQSLVQRDFIDLLAQVRLEVQEQLDELELAWSKVTDAPTTLSGYGITNAYTKEEADNKFIEDTEKDQPNGVAGLDANSKINPLQLPAATETASGIAEIATQAEANAATDNTRFVTPLKLLSAVKNHLNATGSAPMYTFRAFINFDGTGSMTVRQSGNISSIADNGVGDWTLNYAIALNNPSYTPLFGFASGGGSAAQLMVHSDTGEGLASLKTSSQLRIRYKGTGNTTNYDLREAYVGII